MENRGHRNSCWRKISLMLHMLVWNAYYTRISKSGAPRSGRRFRNHQHRDSVLSRRKSARERICIEKKRGPRQGPTPAVLTLKISWRRRSQQGRLKKEDREVKEGQAQGGVQTPRGASV